MLEVSWLKLSLWGLRVHGWGGTGLGFNTQEAILRMKCWGSSLGFGIQDLACSFAEVAQIEEFALQIQKGPIQWSLCPGERVEGPALRPLKGIAMSNNHRLRYGMKTTCHYKPSTFTKLSGKSNERASVRKASWEGSRFGSCMGLLSLLPSKDNAWGLETKAFDLQQGIRW